MSPLSLWCGQFRGRRKAGGPMVTDGVVQVLGPCVGGDVHVGPQRGGMEGWRMHCPSRPRGSQ